MEKMNIEPVIEGDIRKDIVRIYREEFGKLPDIVTSAPGRVNLMGEHTDYNQGYVLPIAIDRRTFTAAGKRGGELFIAFSKELGKKTSFEMMSGRFEHTNFWVNYIKGACSLLGAQKKFDGTNFAIASTVPRGSGLSSSAAYVVSIIEAISHLYGITLEDKDVPVMAQRIENEFVGVQSGIMDPFVAKFAREGFALLIDTKTLEYQHIPMPKDCSILVCVTGVKRALATTEYNRRRQQCLDAVERLSTLLDRTVTSLREVAIDELKSINGKLEPILYMRALHVVTENDRVVKTSAALLNGDLKFVGQLMFESHMSLCENFQVSGPELDAYVDIAQNLDGVYGARMTGAGFGGSAICLVDSSKENELVAKIAHEYKRRGFEDGTVFVAHTGSGPRIERN
jgi:galactokinase